MDRSTVDEPLAHFVADYSTDVGNSLVGHDRIIPVLKRIGEKDLTFYVPHILSSLKTRDHGPGLKNKYIVQEDRGYIIKITFRELGNENEIFSRHT